MVCINCGRRIQDRGLEYCPNCSANIRIQGKIEYYSNYYYNIGLEKAQIRDLSGAITCLKQSLTFNKNNIQARNLLGLVYFETGEVVAALSEWVISKNLSPKKNLAGDYIQRLQANPGRLDAINETIRKYNEALSLARSHQEDMAVVKLKKVLVQNPKLIKGYHLLSLLQMKKGEYSKARRTLRRAAKIDKTNTTTLRFLAEIDQQIGVEKQKAKVTRGFFVNKKTIPLGDEQDLDTADASLVTEPGRGSLFLMLSLGVLVGSLGFYMLWVPGIRQRIYREANRQIVKYSESVSSQGTELTRLLKEARETGVTADAIAGQLVIEKHRSSSYRNLFDAYLALNQEDYDTAALSVQQVYVDTLDDTLTAIYNRIVSATGVTGISESSSNVKDSEVAEYTSGQFIEQAQAAGEDSSQEDYESYTYQGDDSDEGNQDQEEYYDQETAQENSEEDYSYEEDY